ncbi:MAG: excinuclease ABC subunit UvrA [Betaproteobacteria bacterium]|nr:MAG: excinuclease ABC subunit UvrA [Betaproteobacteria bacterium]
MRIRGARQNNLKNIDLDIHTGELTVVTGVSGSGKSSLVFDTLYAEGQRRYVETFSPYARQFLDRMDKPQVDRIEGIPPAIAIDQTNPVRTSRSTVGTMTEVNDHLKLMFARLAVLHCQGCGQAVNRDTSDSIYVDLKLRAAKHDDPRLAITFPVNVPENFSEQEVEQFLSAQGYTRVHERDGATLHVVQDRMRVGTAEKARVMEALEAALLRGAGKVNVFVLPPPGGEGGGEGVRAASNVVQANTLSLDPSPPGGGKLVWRYSSTLHCAACNITYTDPHPSSFSFNNPLGACDTCRGFGRVIGVDLGLVIPDENKTLGEGAVKPWQTPSFKECQDDLTKYMKARHIPMDVPFRELGPNDRRYVIEGDDTWRSWEKDANKRWYGVLRFFDWLETKAYKMHIRVLLSKYRAYTACTACEGARLKPTSLNFRLGSKANADAVLAPTKRFSPRHFAFAAKSRGVLESLPGLTIHDLMLTSIDKLRTFFNTLDLSAQGAVIDEAGELVLGEVRSRLGYLCDVGLGYLTLDRQSRTLSGGEVQRINLTTALGTSLTNTLFVLDEPSIGLHPRDMSRIIGVMQRLKSAGNTLVVVEHDPQIMFAADRLLDIGPGPGERGGNIIFDGSPRDLATTKDSRTAAYLLGRERISRARRMLPPPGGEGWGEGVSKTRASADASTLSPNPSPPGGGEHRITLTGARENNLKNISVSFPLRALVTVTGVSGSGKSSLIQDVLVPAMYKAKGKTTDTPGLYDTLFGHQNVDDVVFVDQSPIGKSSRSNPASFVGAFDAIRAIFAKAAMSVERGYTAGTFSFNAGNGRCASCSGSGFEHVEMQFLSDVYLRCPDCDGTRFRSEIREVVVKEKSISDVLDMTVSEAILFFADQKGGAEVLRTLQPLADVGLEYVRLGQPVPTLSGGEAQRLKLAGHLAESVDGKSIAMLPKRVKGDAETPRGKLFVFDEPTTGLHFEDIAKLLRAFDKLLDAGHSLIVIEHNLDVIATSDWLIDLGPEGGDAGGQVIFEGTPADIRKHKASHTGKALNDYEHDLATLAQSTMHKVEEARGTYLARSAPRSIKVLHAREHNLKNISLEIPPKGFTVITGPSGSGKSTLAFDIIFNEGQRRYLESLNAYARQFVQPSARPDVDAIHGIPPTVAIEQRVSRGGRKSTVATLTEIYHFLRLMWMKVGTQYCPTCDVPIEPQSLDAIAARVIREFKGKQVTVLAPLIINRKGLYTDLAKWAKGKGFSHLRVDGELIPVAPWPRLDRFIEHNIELPIGTNEVSVKNEKTIRAALTQGLEYGKGVVHVLAWKKGTTDAELVVFSTKRACPSCGTSFAELDPRLFSFNSKHGWCASCQGTGESVKGFKLDERTSEEFADRELDAFLDAKEEFEACISCNGARLNPIARNVRFREQGIHDIVAQSVIDVESFVNKLKLNQREEEIARDIVAEVKSRLSFLQEVGLGYLTLNRSAPTLSGGEAQRIRLAAQLGSNLQGVAYILDEPTIGLHPRDNRILLDVLEKLQAKGNTLIVVEHDEDTIKRAHHIIDLGPGAGVRGGEIVAEGTAAELKANPNSITGRFLKNPLKHPLHQRAALSLPPGGRVPKAGEGVRTVAVSAKAKPAASLNTLSPNPSPPGGGEQLWIEINGASLNNLRNVDAKLPLARLNVITGVSGSGKSTLAREVLHTNLEALVFAKNNRKKEPAILGCKSIEGWETIDRVLEVDQTPIGKTPRSCPATYIGFWDNIRKLYAETTESKMRGYGPGRFSFNAKGGRCDACDGAGVKTIEMNFLPDVKLPCDVCNGARFNSETLSVLWREKSIGDVLKMDVDDAVEFFATMPSIHHPLKLMQDVGLGYLTLGQQSPTLSGGEAQRIKLVTELAKVRAPIVLTESTDPKDAPKLPKKAQKLAKSPLPSVAVKAVGSGRRSLNPHTLYVLDEPTVGLHMADVEKLIHVLHRLVDGGNTVILIEHNLDLIAEADWIIDMGPEGGTGGGEIVVQGDLPTLLKAKTYSHTGRVLSEFL